MALVQFLSSIQELELSLLTDQILKGMLNLIVIIIRMHCAPHEQSKTSSLDTAKAAQNRLLGIQGTGILLRMLKKDKRTL